MPSLKERASAPAKPATAGTGKAPPPREIKASNAAPAGKYAGMRGAAPRFPMLEEFDGVLEFIKTYESKNPKTGAWFHADFVVIKNNDPERYPKHLDGTKCTVLQCVSDKAIEVGGPIVVSIVVAGSGCASDDEFFENFDGRDEDHPDANVLLDCASGASKKIENPLGGQKVKVSSYPTKVSAKGDQYYGQTWEPYVEAVGDDASE